MRILFVTHFFPFPPNDGGRIGYFNPIKYLSRRHEVVLASLATPSDLSYVPEMKRYCLEVRTHARNGGGDLVRLAKGLGSTPPGAAAKYWDTGFGELVRKCVDQYSVDLVEFHHLNTAAYHRFVDAVPAILRQHNVEHKVWERHAQSAAGLIERSYVRFCVPRVRTYEAAMARQFARCIMVSEADARHLLKIAPTANVVVIPSGVDTEYFYPRPETDRDPDSIVITGSFEWRPKQHNLRVLLQEIFPRIRAKVPLAKLYVVGKGVPHQLRELAERTPGVVVMGLVADVRPYVWRSSLVLNYLESGGGIALKVLEAMAMHRPVLSNTLGCEGIEVEHGKEVFLADGPEEYAEAAVFLLRNAEFRQNLAANGYAKALEKYAWTRIADDLSRCYADVTREHKAERRHSAFAQSSFH